MWCSMTKHKCPFCDDYPSVYWMTLCEHVYDKHGEEPLASLNWLKRYSAELAVRDIMKGTIPPGHAPKIHIYKAHASPNEPGGREIILTLCGYSEELSNSGRFSDNVAYESINATCEACARIEYL